MGAAAAERVVHLPGDRIEQDPEEGRSTLDEPDAHHELRAPLDEGVGPVDGVHHPEAAAVEPVGRGGALLGEPPVLRPLGEEEVVEDAVGGQVRGGHGLVDLLEAHVELGAEVAENGLARGEHCGAGEVEIGEEIRGRGHARGQRPPTSRERRYISAARSGWPLRS
jgi:hypothetical protein